MAGPSQRGRWRSGLARAIGGRRIQKAGAPPARAPVLSGLASRSTQLPGRPFSLAVDARGEHAYVTQHLPEERGIVVLGRERAWRVERTVPLPEGLEPRGLAPTPDGRHLLIANEEGGLFVVEMARLHDGSADAVVATIPTDASGSVQVAIEPGGRFAFVSDEWSGAISVFDVGSSSFVGRRRVHPGPVGVACSSDGDHLFVVCSGRERNRYAGVVSAFRVAELVEDPRSAAAVGTADAGSSPVRVVLSGGHAWVTARGSNALLSFDVEALTAGRKALRVVLPVGPNPIGVATVHAGSVVVTANSNRYGGEPHRPQSLSVVDAAAALAGRPALRGFVPAGAFPRQLVALPDDRTVLFVNVFSQTLQEVEIPPIQ